MYLAIHIFNLSIHIRLELSVSVNHLQDGEHAAKHLHLGVVPKAGMSSLEKYGEPFLF